MELALAGAGVNISCSGQPMRAVLVNPALPPSTVRLRVHLIMATPLLLPQMGK